MPWYFYNKDSVVVPRSPSTLAPGDIILSTAPISLSPPDGFLFCDGSPYLKNDYLDLYAEIVGRFGENNPTINYFNVPDLTDIFPRGAITSANLGLTGGQLTHLHTMGVHSHTGVTAGTHSHTVSADVHTHTIPHTHTLSGHSHAGTGPDNAQTAMVLGASNSNISLNFISAADDYSADGSHAHLSGGIYVVNSTGVATPQNASSQPTPASSNSPSTTGVGNGSTAANTNAFTQVSSTVANTPPFVTLSFLIKT